MQKCLNKKQILKNILMSRFWREDSKRHRVDNRLLNFILHEESRPSHQRTKLLLSDGCHVISAPNLGFMITNVYKSHEQLKKLKYNLHKSIFGKVTSAETCQKSEQSIH